MKAGSMACYVMAMIFYVIAFIFVIKKEKAAGLIPCLKKNKRIMILQGWFLI